jgi:pimeloyl-ACP methyl ester carboxylesterase
MFFMTSVLTSSLLLDEVHSKAVRANACLIPVERPGCGLSSPAPGMGYDGFPPYLERLADHLGIGRFDVVAHSSGAPFALALAAALPDRVRCLFLCNARLAPPADETNTTDMVPTYFNALRRYPWVVEATSAILWNKMSRHIIRPMILRFFENSPVDYELVRNDPVLVDYLLECSAEALSTTFEGFLRETSLFLERIRIPPERVKTPIIAWHGGEDRIVPYEDTRARLRDYPVVEFRVLPGQGHLMARGIWPESFARISEMP